jgi:hypothetical protein
MNDIEDELRKINELGSEYEKRLDADEEKLTDTRKQEEVIGAAVKEKIMNLEAKLTHRMPFEVRYPIGEFSGIPTFPYRAQVYLIKTDENKIRVFLSHPGGAALDVSYADANAEILTMITDQKIDGFLNAIQEMLKMNLSK